MSYTPRPRQAVFIEKCTAALIERGDTLGVAPTGAGKTVCAGHTVRNVYRQLDKGAHLFLQHRDELVDQNSNTLFKIDSSIPIGFMVDGKKRWAQSGVTFAMIQTLVNNLASMPPLVSLTIDEAHHSAADSYLRVIDHARKANPDVKLFGVTATPNRGDRKSLRAVFSNVADQITIGELVATGFLVRPRGFAVDVGITDALQQLDQEASRRRFSENELLMAADKLMNKSPITDKVIEFWKHGDERTGLPSCAHRPTVVFCSTVDHAKAVSDAFCAAGVRAAYIDGTMPKSERKAILKAYDKGEIQVICNVAVLTEGWDHQPTSCAILLRPKSFKSTMMQMIGRALRTVDPERYPGVIKDDAVVMDFGTSLLTYGNLETSASIDGDGLKTCPACAAQVPVQCGECPLCGYEWPKEAVEETVEAEPREKAKRVDIDAFVLREIGDLLQASPYRWEPFFQGVAMIAEARTAWGMIVLYEGRWHALGGSKETGVHILAITAEQANALAVADDYLRQNGDEDASGKAARWAAEPPTDKQLALLKIDPMQAMALGITRYRASCELTWKFQKSAVQLKLAQNSLASRVPSLSAAQ